MKPKGNCLVDSVLVGSPSRASAERQLAAMALGTVEAIRNRKLTGAESTHALFTLENYNALRRHRLNRDLVELFQWGMELENVVELAPEGLEESLQSMARLGKRVMAGFRGRIERLAQTGTG